MKKKLGISFPLMSEDFAVEDRNGYSLQLNSTELHARYFVMR